MNHTQRKPVPRQQVQDAKCREAANEGLELEKDEKDEHKKLSQDLYNYTADEKKKAKNGTARQNAFAQAGSNPRGQR